jgi:hypothetical protein
MLSEPKPALGIYFHQGFQLTPPAGEVLGIELNGEKPIFHHLIQFPTSCINPEMLSEPKLAMGIYFHRGFQLPPPAGAVRIELNGEKSIFNHLIQFPTSCTYLEMLSEPKPAIGTYFHHQF